MKTVFLTVIFSALVLPCFAQQPTPEPSPAADSPAAKIAEIVKGLHYQQGQVPLGEGMAKLAIPPNFRFLGPDDSETVLVRLWGNPPLHRKPLGMVLPAEVGPADPGSWAVVVTYEEGGYVKDNDADKIKYDDLLKEMQKDTLAANPRRTQQGYEPMELIGWAAPPHYDKAAKKLYWAKELRIGGNTEHTLNYDVRILGRRGMLVLTGVAGMDQLAQIESATPAILSMVEFNQGHRYADFDPRTDKVAAYGIAALVAGGVAAKMGLFKLAWIAILGAKKFVIIAVVAIGSWIRRFFKPKSQEG